jgi:hypothetical protein
VRACPACRPEFNSLNCHVLCVPSIVCVWGGKGRCVCVCARGCTCLGSVCEKKRKEHGAGSAHSLFRFCSAPLLSLSLLATGAAARPGRPPLTRPSACGSPTPTPGSPACMPAQPPCPPDVWAPVLKWRNPATGKVRVHERPSERESRRAGPTPAAVDPHPEKSPPPHDPLLYHTLSPHTRRTRRPLNRPTRVTETCG